VAGFIPGGRSFGSPTGGSSWARTHDHVGSFSGTGDTIYNGADDNASGVSGVLELARALSARAQRPAGMASSYHLHGEEEWLLGSAAGFERHLLRRII